MNPKKGSDENPKKNWADNPRKESGENLKKESGDNVKKESGENLRKELVVIVKKDPADNLRKELVVIVKKEPADDLRKELVVIVKKESAENLKKESADNPKKESAENIKRDSNDIVKKDPNLVIGRCLGDGKVKIEKQYEKAQGRDLYTGLYYLTSDNPIPIFIKVKRNDQQIRWLRHESKVYEIIRHFRCKRQVPLWYYQGSVGEDFDILCLEFLGPTLHEMWYLCEKQFSIIALAHIGFQLIGLMQYIHGCGLIYRNIHSAHFVYGPSGSDRWNRLFLVDLRYCRQWHRKSTAPWCGTPYRFMPISGHLGEEYTRKDDLESMAYLLAYFYERTLPWINLENLPRTEIHRKMAQAKKINGPRIFSRMLPEYGKFYRMIRKNKPDDTPKYDDLQKLFQDVKLSVGFQNMNQWFDFDQNHRLKEY